MMRQFFPCFYPWRRVVVALCLLASLMLAGCSADGGGARDQAERALGHTLPADAAEVRFHRQAPSPAEAWYGAWMSFTTTEASFERFAEGLGLSCGGGSGTFLVSAGQFQLPSWADSLPWWLPPAALAPLACGRSTDDGFIVAQFEEGRTWLVVEGGWPAPP